jgi:hypothetical protein
VNDAVNHFMLTHQKLSWEWEDFVQQNVFIVKKNTQLRWYARTVVGYF